MSQPLQTCTHIHDTGGTCNSIAAKNQHYCVYHLRHRARLMRMAQARARSERFDLKLPPLESMHAVQSALTQLMEAVAADIIDLKRADRLIRILNVASRNLLKADKWCAPVFHSDQAAEVDVAAEYGLPADLDLDTPTEVAFPAAAAVKEHGPGFSREPAYSTAPGSPFAASADIEFSPDFPISPENVEVCEIYATHGPDAAQVRSEQLDRNRARRELRLNRKRFAAIALRSNVQVAAQKLALRKLAAAGEAPCPSTQAARKPPASVATDAATDISENTELSRTGSNG